MQLKRKFSSERAPPTTTRKPQTRSYRIYFSKVNRSQHSIPVGERFRTPCRELCQLGKCGFEHSIMLLDNSRTQTGKWCTAKFWGARLEWEGLCNLVDLFHGGQFTGSKHFIFIQIRPFKLSSSHAVTPKASQDPLIVVDDNQFMRFSSMHIYAFTLTHARKKQAAGMPVTLAFWGRRAVCERRTGGSLKHPWEAQQPSKANVTGTSYC